MSIVGLIVLVVLSVLLMEGTEYILYAFDVVPARAWDYIIGAIYFCGMLYLAWNDDTVQAHKHTHDDL